MSKKIFLIEDDALILSSFKAKLRVMGFEVEFNEGDEDEVLVMNKIKSFDPQYIILDLFLPKADGYQLLSRIKSDDFTMNIPVFVFSDLSDEDVKKRCENLGAEYYFLKQNFNTNEFLTKFKKIIENRHKR